MNGISNERTTHGLSIGTRMISLSQLEPELKAL